MSVWSAKRKLSRNGLRGHLGSVTFSWGRTSSMRTSEERCVAGAIEALDPEINVICLWSLMSNATRRPSGESAEFSGERGRGSCF